MKQIGKTYFPGLDNLRTLAILMVVLTHIPQTWPADLSAPAQALIYFFYAGGKIGVSILFLMTGFLMAWLHPRPASTVEFWSRRIARIFPLFLVMVASLTIIRASGNHLPVLTQIGLILGFGLIARLLAKPIGRKLTIVWLIFMLAAAAGYILLQIKVPPAVFYQIWDPNWRWLITGLVNAAMALPFGQYVAQLDGVYWALILEFWFYLLYPILFVPLFNKLNWKFFPASMFFGFGLSLLADRILGFKMLEPAFIIYFIAGVSLGKNLTWWQKRIRPLPLLPLLIFISAGQYYLTRWLPEFYYPWMRLILVGPVGLLVLLATLGGKTGFNGLAKYSYAMFLTHSLVIEWCARIIRPTNFLTNLALIIVSLTTTLGLSIILYYLAEKPYFISQKLANAHTVTGYAKPLLGLILITLLLLDRAFRPPLAFFTEFAREKKFDFTAKDNNLGMITAHLKGENASGQAWFRLYGKQGLISQTVYKAADIYEDRYHPFGFPIQENSKDKSYTLEFEFLADKDGGTVKLVDQEQKFLSVYFNPENKWRWLINKLTSPYTNPIYWLTLLYLAPLLIMLKLNRFK